MSKPTSAFLYYTNVSWWTKRRKKTPCKYIRIQKMLATLIDVVEMEIFFQMVGKLHFRRLICARQITYWIIFHHSKQASLVCVYMCLCLEMICERYSIAEHRTAWKWKWTWKRKIKIDLNSNYNENRMVSTAFVCQIKDLLHLDVWHV